MSQKNDGGPAFPVEESDGVQAWGGMTLRDYFAAKALTGAIIDQEAAWDDLQQMTEWCYLVADAMLAARDK